MTNEIEKLSENESQIDSINGKNDYAENNDNGFEENNEDIAIREEKLINEEYKVWKKNSPFLYDMLITHALEWPSLTVQWFPDIERPDNKDYKVQRLLLGTHTTNNDQNYLQIANVQIPREDIEISEIINGASEFAELGGYGAAECKVVVTQQINHDGEINRARYMPQNPDIIATKTVVENGAVYIFDRTKHPSKPSGSACKPEIKLGGHTKEGYGLAWNKFLEGHILSASEDGTVCYWDIMATPTQTQQGFSSPIYKYVAHEGTVAEDIDWHSYHKHIFASVGDDFFLRIFDTRTNKIAKEVQAHSAEVNCVAFNPLSETLLATGSADCTIALWDLRMISKKLHSLESHNSEILQLEWQPANTTSGIETSGTILASSSSDRRVNIWDIGRIGDEQSNEDAADGPPELIFVHGGHTNRVCDLSWNPNELFTLCTVAEDNIVQVWQMANNIYSREESLSVDSATVE
ncbi:hypothetical protein BB559_004871 [Furculomyces boomerangus]|uniref:Histone-binding protein RBBP4-like N-terminal domain-containing protein n=2 Tax=Harpellales TaxID=61421 RepID=A0A2T9Y7M1_9FUNG|nr:hypothetical protein BB559_005611 [Furculomyces boomerangus]PVU89909.1 hypothetical protein BB559_004871 [Furculomyces boomerangus]PVZ96792.1 hypothetical protein BB558_007270 [Smittium angustum]PVZ99070.1 hypothetical protein BB558_004913 [Smittium angustum]